MSKDVENNEKDFFKHTSRKRSTRQNVDLLLNEM